MLLSYRKAPAFLGRGGTWHWGVEVIWKRRPQACGHTTPLWPWFREHVGLIWLHFVGRSAPALFHLKIIISYGNSDVKLIWVGLRAVNKLELL